MTIDMQLCLDKATLQLTADDEAVALLDEYHQSQVNLAIFCDLPRGHTGKHSGEFRCNCGQQHDNVRMAWQR